MQRTLARVGKKPAACPPDGMHDATGLGRTSVHLGPHNKDSETISTVKTHTSTPPRKATASDVAREAGVSKWTVARAFTAGASISPHSRESVMAVAQRLGYRPNLLARSLSTKRTHQVAVMVDDFANPHKLLALEMLTAELQANNLMAMLIHIGEAFDDTHAFLTADQRQVDAVVMFGSGFRASTLQQTQRDDSPPLYVLARESTIDGVPSVSCDVEPSMGEIVAHLAGKGYRRPGFMSGPKPLLTQVGRQQYHAKHWLKRGIDNIVEIPSGQYSLDAAQKALRHYLRSTPEAERIDALVCENDVLALGAIDVARHEFGLQVPGQLAIVGYDGIELGRLASFGLTTYEQPMREMVRVLVEMILGQREPASLALRGRLILRQSA